MRFRFADCVLDADRFELTRAGEPVATQPKALELLLFLLRNRERTVSKEELLAGVWRDTTTGESSLTRAVSIARSALGERERKATVIRTVRGRGYRIGVPVVVDSPTAVAPATADFVCRERELALARDVLHEAVVNRGQLLLLIGEPGIGKTRMAAELENMARTRGAEVHWGRCEDGANGPPYAPWVQILRSALARHDFDALGAGLSEAAAAELAEHIPDLRDALPELPAPSRNPEKERELLLDGIGAWLERRAAEAPQLLVLDDLHRADGPSLRLLSAIADAIAPWHVLLVGTYRDLEVSQFHPLAATLVELRRARTPRREVQLHGLEPGCVRRFVAAQIGREPSPALVNMCHARTEGNPLFLTELVQWLESRAALDAPPETFEREIPDGIRHVIRDRIGTLSPGCREALAAAAVIGRKFRVDLAGEAGQLERETLFLHLRRGEEAHVVEPTRSSPGFFRFTHPLIREVLYEELSGVERSRVHARVALALERFYRPQPLVPTDLVVDMRGTRLAELAHHFSEGLPFSEGAKALDYAEQAGDFAMAQMAFEDALRHFESALAVLEGVAPYAEERRARIDARRIEARARLTSLP
jgi:predicted ATPase